MDFTQRADSETDGQDGNRGEKKKQNFHRSHGDSSALRVLCLHDEHSNASELCHALEALGERLYDRHNIDLVYVNSPLLSIGKGDRSVGAGTQRTPANGASNEGGTEGAQGEQGRTWFERYEVENDESMSSSQNEDGEINALPESQQNDDFNATASRITKYVGLDASLLLLKQVWKSMPFWGFIAVGQGASIATFLPLLPVDPPPSVGIFINGATLFQESERLDDRLTALHLLDEESGSIPERLVLQFGGEVKKLRKSPEIDRSLHKYGWNTASTMNAIGKFLVDQKKSMQSSAAQSTVLSLQNQLHVAEQEAADLVAEEIARDPPAALMAVISPQHLGGWNGRKRDVGAGGAPCPPEFVLRREKREVKTGPSRVHPTQAPSESDSRPDNTRA